MSTKLDEVMAGGKNFTMGTCLGRGRSQRDFPEDADSRKLVDI
jgi:hypothetical protein